MYLYSEIPGHRDSNGNKNRSIFHRSSPEQLPELESGSMFFFLLTDKELRVSSHILAEKMKDFGNTVAEALFNAILSRQAPEGWRMEEIILPNRDADHGIHIFRSNRYAEQIIVLADDLEQILRGHKIFEQGNTVSTMLQKFQVAVYLFAKRVADGLVHSSVQTRHDANMLKRTADRFCKHWELAQSSFDRQDQWNEVARLAKLASEHAEKEREYFANESPHAAPVSIQAGRDVNVAGGDMPHHNHLPARGISNFWLPLIVTIIGGLVVAYLTFKFGWQGDLNSAI